MMDAQFDLRSNSKIEFISIVSDNLKCGICKNVLNDSCVSQCGCKFCSKCIKEYLINGEQMCPGEKEECTVSRLDLSTNIAKDPSSNIEISYLMVNCPHNNCDYRCQLRMLPEHTRMCSKAPQDCVYSMVGCKEIFLVSELMKDHLDECCVSHSKMLLSYIRNMENEIKLTINSFDARLNQVITERNDLRNIVEKFLVSMDSFRNQVGNSQTSETDVAEVKDETDIKAMQTELKDFATLQLRLQDCEKRQMDTELEMKMVKTLIQEREEQRNILVNDTRPPMKNGKLTREKSRRQKEEMSGTKEQTENLIRQNFVKLRNLCDKSMVKLRMLKTYKDDKTNEKQSNECKTNEYEMFDDNEYGAVADMATFSTSVNFFSWTIKNVESKYNSKTAEYSLPFYSDGESDGYKMCLYFGIHHLYGLWLTFRLLCGNNDDNLEWPMKRMVSIEVLDENSQLPVMSELVCYDNTNNRKFPVKRQSAYLRPQGDGNDVGDGFVYTHSYDDLKAIPGAISRNTMLIRCIVMKIA